MLEIEETLKAFYKLWFEDVFKTYRCYDTIAQNTALNSYVVRRVGGG